MLKNYQIQDKKTYFELKKLAEQDGVVKTRTIEYRHPKSISALSRTARGRGSKPIIGGAGPRPCERDATEIDAHKIYQEVRSEKLGQKENYVFYGTE